MKEYKGKVEEAERERLFKEVSNRFRTKLMPEGPVVSAVECTITWNTDRNIPRITFDLGMNKVQE